MAFFLPARAETARLSVPVADSSDVEPYASGRSFGGHLLALPAYAFDLITRPVGYGLRRAEEIAPRLLEGERGDYGVFPLLELGGDTGAAFGLLAFHNKPFRDTHNARIEALFGSREYNDFQFEYRINRFLTPGGRLDLQGTYANRPDRAFLFGNSADFEDRSFYDRENTELSLRYTYRLSARHSLRLNTDYLSRNITRSARDNEAGVPAFPADLRSNSSIFSTGLLLRLDKARGPRRIVRGNRLITNLEWSRSLSNTRYHYLNYTAEAHQFLPVPLLPENRRLAFKARLEKAEPLGERDIPFYENPSLGSSESLRGFSTDRFRDSGALLFTLEYRYPIWDFSDIVLFVDEGQVFNHFSDISPHRFHASYGIGVHLISAAGLALRSEVAFSREDSRFILLISPNF
ncbi:MAG: BamA/TamA family outer membrane protein [Cyclonatronaceae bacterium]